MIKPYIVLLLFISNIFSQEEFNIKSLINYDGIYKKIGSMEPAAGLVFSIVNNKKINNDKIDPEIK